MTSKAYSTLHAARELMQTYAKYLTDQLPGTQHIQTLLTARNGGKVLTSVQLESEKGSHWYLFGFDPEDDQEELEKLAEQGAGFVKATPIIGKDPGRLFERAVVTGIYDGDTMDVDVHIDIGFHSETIHSRRLRVARIDAWERRGPEKEKGMRALSRVEELCPVGSTIALRVYGKGKYGRWISDIILPDGSDLSDTLVLEGHAVYKDY